MKILLLSLLLLPVWAFARIGENEAQIVARYGISVGPCKGGSVYEKAGFTIVVQYNAGISVAEFVSKSVNLTEPDFPLPGERLTDTEIKALLAVYGNGLSWEKDTFKQNWLRADKNVAASLNDKQPVDGRNLSKLRAEAAQMTPALVFMDVAFATMAAKKLETEVQKVLQEQKQVEAGGVAAAFGPIPPVFPTPAPLVIPWRLPPAPYPYQARANHLSGSGTIEITTNSTGHCSNAVIVQSSGSSILDNSLATFAQANWGGPPNSSKIVPFTYRVNEPVNP